MSKQMQYAVNISLPHEETADLLADLIVTGKFQAWINEEMKERKIAGQLREYAEKVDTNLNKPRLCTHSLTIKPEYGG